MKGGGRGEEYQRDTGGRKYDKEGMAEEDEIRGVGEKEDKQHNGDDGGGAKTIIHLHVD